MTKAYATLVLAFLLVGCTGGVDRRTGPEIDSSEASLTFTEPIEHLNVLAYEPMVVEHPDGTLFLAGFAWQQYGEPPNLWKSGDGGATWERLDVGVAADGAVGNSDVDLAVARDGTLYYITMGFDRSDQEGTHVAVGASRDNGASWNWTYLSKAPFADRPWIDVAPDGTVHAIWNDGMGVLHAVSADRGRSWFERSRVHPKGGSSHLAVGPNGEVAVRITPESASGWQFDEGVELIAVSTDGGQSWVKHPSPAQPVWDHTWEDPNIIPHWVEPIAWDAAGALYHLWSEGQDLWLVRSLDRGESWKKWHVARHEDRIFFPYLTARGPGELAATWFSGREETLQANVARIDVPLADDAEPRVTTLPPFQPDTWYEEDGKRSRGPAGEYFPAILLSDGELGVVSTIENEEANRLGFSWRRTATENGR